MPRGGFRGHHPHHPPFTPHPPFPPFVNGEEFPWNGIIDVVGSVFGDFDPVGRGGPRRHGHRHGHGDEDGIRVSPLFSARCGRGLGGHGGSGDASSKHSASVDVFDTPESYIIVASVPGASPSKIGVDFDHSTRELTISGETPPSLAGKNDEYRDNYLKIHERTYGEFERKITFPEEPAVDEENIQAKFSNGLLKVTVPKIEPVPVEKKKVVVTLDSDGDEELVDVPGTEEKAEELADTATIVEEKAEGKTADVSEDDSVLVETPDEQ
jgi:HSP20 family molecular chaperone IbpA